MSEQILIGRDDYPDLTEKEKERIWKYQKDRADAGETLCPYSRVGKRGVLYCKIFGRRCYFSEDYIFCTDFQDWLLEADRVKEENEMLENLLPVGAPL